MAKSTVSKAASDNEKFNLVKYIAQVRQEGRKVVWPTRRETMVTTLLVMIMVVIMGAFFFFVDWVLALIIRFVLGFGG